MPIQDLSQLETTNQQVLLSKLRSQQGIDYKPLDHPYNFVFFILSFSNVY
jgi:hypothetical protein